MAIDHFIEGGGYKKLCVAMMKDAALVLARDKDDKESSDARAWLEGEMSIVPFSLCVAAIGLENYEENVRDFILSDPRNAANALANAQDSQWLGTRVNFLASMDRDADIMTSYRRAARQVG